MAKQDSVETRVEDLVSKSRYREALALIAATRGSDSNDRLQQQKGVALARLGYADAARKTLESLYKRGKRDIETVSIYARTLMDRYDRTGKVDYLEQSRDLYAQALRLSRKRDPDEQYYPAVNAAAKSVFLGDRRAATRYANVAEKIVGKTPTSGDYWKTATAAEVQLIKREYDLAAELYKQAVDQAPDLHGSHGSTWLQARRLMEALETPPAKQAAIWEPFSHLSDAPPDPSLLTPPYRRLRVYAFDPSFQRLETIGVNELTLQVRWEMSPEADGASGSTGGAGEPGDDSRSSLGLGPTGEYLEVVDYDPASGCFYEPVDLDDPRLLATDGLPPSEGDPKFHQQMVYGVAMNVIEHFETALGRRALWSSRLVRDERGRVTGEEFVPKLRIYPHALREANAYYSPAKKALLFGYFPAESDDPQLLSGGTVFTCLSHDVIAHEMSHALLDGLHPRFSEPTNVDVLAFHEAFADIVALFQHFSHAEVLRHEIARTRGDLASQSLLGQLAHQFGRAIGERGALRDAIGKVDPETGEWRPQDPDPGALRTTDEPHGRGAILVAAVFDAFLTIYRTRIEDLLRIASQGSGILAPGALPPDLVDRLANEAAKSATHLLHICIRALDYCPPVDITFGDYLRAIITADFDMVPNDRLHYRLALIEAFQRRGIYPGDVRNLSVESLVWRPPRGDGSDLSTLFKDDRGRAALSPEWRPTADRRELWEHMRTNAVAVQRWFLDSCSPLVADELGLVLSSTAPRSFYFKRGRPAVEVHSVRVARRTAPGGGSVTDLVVEVMQRRRGYFDPDRQEQVDKQKRILPGADRGDFTFRGGCTLLIDPATSSVRYAITKHMLSGRRLRQQRGFLTGEDSSLRATYFGDPTRGNGREPFAILHRPADG